MEKIRAMLGHRGLRQPRHVLPSGMQATHGMSCSLICRDIMAVVAGIRALGYAARGFCAVVDLNNVAEGLS